MDKEKVKKIFARIGFGISAFLNVVFVSACVYGCANQDKQAKAECDIQEENVSFHYDNKKMVSYNDESYEITFNADELNNYHWDNFNEYCYQFSLAYDGMGFLVEVNYNDYSCELYDWSNDNINVMLDFRDTGENYRITFNTYQSGGVDYSTDDNKFYFNNNIFTTGFVLVIESSEYIDVKSAIEGDIQANSGANPNTDIIYNDNDMTISLPSSVVNDTKFKSFYDYISQDNRYNDIDLIYKQNTYTFETNDDGRIYYDYEDNYTIDFVYNNVFYNQENSTNFDNYTFHYISADFEDFDSYLVIDVSELGLTSYYRIKSAIEYDILESNYSNDSIFTNLTASVVAFIGSISSGITAMTSVFYANGQLTAIGLLSVIVVAIALSYFLFRLIIGLIRMRG